MSKTTILDAVKIQARAVIPIVKALERELRFATPGTICNAWHVLHVLQRLAPSGSLHE